MIDVNGMLRNDVDSRSNWQGIIATRECKKEPEDLK